VIRTTTIGPTVQISLDLTSLDEALEVAEVAVGAGVDWLEAGTPLLLAEGMRAVRALRERFPDHPIVADLKIMDGGGLETELAAEAGAVVIAACLRNAPAVAQSLATTTLPVTVLACGERWPNGTLRPSLEDLLGAGAVLSSLGGDFSPEAKSAAAAWQDAKDDVANAILSCASGRELVERGFRDDVEYACAYGVSDVVPVLVDGAFRHRKEPLER